MHDIGVGDRQNHPRLMLPEPHIERVLQVNHVRLARRAMFGIHAVIGGEHDRRSQSVEPREMAVDHRVEIIRHRRARRGLVLDVVGGREVHQIRPLALHQLDPRDEDEFRQLRAEHRRRPRDSIRWK